MENELLTITCMGIDNSINIVLISRVICHMTNLVEIVDY